MLLVGPVQSSGSLTTRIRHAHDGVMIFTNITRIQCHLIESLTTRSVPCSCTRSGLLTGAVPRLALRLSSSCSRSVKPVSAAASFSREASTCMTAGNLGSWALAKPHERIELTCRTPTQTRNCDSLEFTTAALPPIRLTSNTVSAARRGERSQPAGVPCGAGLCVYDGKRPVKPGQTLKKQKAGTSAPAVAGSGAFGLSAGCRTPASCASGRWGRPSQAAGRRDGRPGRTR